MIRAGLLMRITLTAVVAVFGSTCGGDSSATGPGGSGNPPTTLTSIVVTPGSSSLAAIGQTVQLSAEARDQNGVNISGVSFTWSSSNESIATVTSAGLVTSVGSGGATISASAGGRTGSATVTVSLPPPNQAPTATLSSPSNGATFTTGESISFQGSASDPEDGALTGSSLVWASSLDGQIGTGTNFSRSDLSAGSHMIVLTATDADGATGNSSVSITVNVPPSASITAPANASMFDEGVSVTFTGTGTDAEDGALSGTSLVWTSSLDGAIGTGTSFNKSDLSIGAHTVALTVTDSDGASNAASILVTIVAVPNAPPTATITAPPDAGSAVSGASVAFAGTGSDPEDGAITGAALVWTSDLDGVIGTGGSFSTTTLSGGTHTIVLTATDSEAAVGTDTITFSITGGAPVVAITAPVVQGNGAPHTVFEATGVTFTGSATDPDDGPLTGGSLVWTSNVDGQIGTGETFLTAALTDGMHTVTLTATDSDANESKATVLTIVKPASAAGFQIHIRLSEGVTLTGTQQAAVDAAVAKLEAVITGDVPDLALISVGAGLCALATRPALNESIDDVIIYVEFVPIDGPGMILGSAGPCFFRSGTAFSLVGGMRFDSEDLDFIEGLGLLEDIIVHEMMHVLGFGIFWEDLNPPPDFPDYLEQPSNSGNPGYTPGMTDTHFTGPAALTEFAAIGGGSYTGGNIVPVENDTASFFTGSLDGHWRESVFDEELMTPAANLGSNPMSSLTIAQFSDLGYTVDLTAADSYSQVFSIVLGPVAEKVKVDLSGDVWRGRIDAIEPDGTIRRIR